MVYNGSLTRDLLFYFTVLFLVHVAYNLLYVKLLYSWMLTLNNEAR